MRRQQQHIMIADQNVDAATDSRCLLPQPDDQLDNANAVWPVIDQIAHEPECAVRAAPGITRIDQTCAAQEIEELFALPVDISNNMDGGHRFLPYDSLQSSF